MRPTLLLLALAFTSCSDNRYQLAQGEIDQGGQRVPLFARIDTHTGETWLFERFALPAQGTNDPVIWEGWERVEPLQSNYVKQLSLRRSR